MAMDEPPLPLLAPENLRHPELEQRFRRRLRGGIGPPLQAHQAGDIASHRGAEGLLAVAAAGEMRGRPVEPGADLLPAMLEAAETAENRHILPMGKEALDPRRIPRDEVALRRRELAHRFFP